MKNKLIIPITVLSISLGAVACNGDHSDRTVRDTTGTAESHVDPSMKTPPSNIDTSKTSGGASTVDNSGSGGSKIDSIKKTKPNK